MGLKSLEATPVVNCASPDHNENCIRNEAENIRDKSLGHKPMSKNLVLKEIVT